MNERQFIEFDLNERMDIINLNGIYVGNRSYYNHSINLYTVYGFFVEVWYAVLCPRYGVTLHGTFRVRLCIPALCLGLLQVELIEGVIVFFFGSARRGRVFTAPPPTST